MLSPTARPYIDASVPVLRAHGTAITRCFYQRLFAAHPELTNLFNIGNQANGSQQQSLAAAIFAYAANYDDAAALAPVVERIVHKHAAVGIKPAHYPIVGRHLIAAIREVLGDAASPDLLAAWDEAYWLLAGELIAAEARLYQHSGTTAGALQALKIKQVRAEGTDIVSYYLQTPAGTSPGLFLPGQYVSAAVNFGDGSHQRRQYSLSDAPGRPWWRLTVKREDGGGNTPAGKVSTWIHAKLQAGDTLWVSIPFGNFTPTLDGAQPIVLLSAGVGITPMISVLNTLLDRNPMRPVVFAYAACNSDHHALRADLTDARARHAKLTTVVFYEMPLEHDRPGIDYDHVGRMNLASVIDDQYGAADYYLCGPIGFMQQQRKMLLARGVAPAHIHREVFGPDMLDHLQ
ncbi:MAG: flavohemoprotein [Gammaproteobacteria bacterium]|nr:flavohemoprotein [Gammaproteobacteria bacterium]